MLKPKDETNKIDSLNSNENETKKNSKEQKNEINKFKNNITAQSSEPLNKNLTHSTTPSNKQNKFKSFIKTEIIETKLLFKSIPSWVIVMFTLSVVLMNLFANKSINTGLSWLALDCGIILSWASFLSMDMIVKRFGAKASTKISIVVLLINLFIAFIFFIVANISGFWGESFIDFGGDVANTALNNTLASSWFVILGSSVAFIVSAIINNVLNAFIGKLFKNKNFVEYSMRSYLSTIIGQFVDNLIFAFIVSLNFFGWTPLQCVTCAITGATVELLFEIIFSPIGFKVCKNWEKNNVGIEYLNYCNEKKLNKNT